MNQIAKKEHKSFENDLFDHFGYRKQMGRKRI